MKTIPYRWFLVPSLLLCSPALALSPSEVFEKVSPSVWAVRSLDAQERPFSYGSAVVVGPGQLVTNCHVLAKAKGIQLRRENITYDAKLEHADVERDLCLLSAKNLNAPPVTIGKLSEVKVGQRVFAIGNPERLALTLSEGLVSGLRGEEGNPVLQTTAPISPGSSGGGLFDDRGQLLGITSFGVVNRQRTSQNLNFAVPAEWIAEVPERAKLALERRNQPAAGGAAVSGPAGVKQIAGLPAVGASWTYSFQDLQYSGPSRSFTIRVDAVSDREVRESFQDGSGADRHVTVQPDQIRFTSHRLTSDYSIIELAPYFFSGPKRDEGRARSPAGYPAREAYRIDSIQLRDEAVSVPAGTFKATRLDVSGSLADGTVLSSHTTTNTSMVLRFHYSAWYAPEVNRYVMVRHQTWNPRGMPLSDERTQLTEYRKSP